MATKRRWWLIGGVVAVVSCAFAVACSNGGSGGSATQAAQQTYFAATTDINVDLTDFAIALSSGSALEGRTTFHLTSSGVTPHNLRVIKTEIDPAGLPYNTVSQTVDESSLSVVGVSDDINPGTTGTVITNLVPGSYVLICNLPAHYAQGMRVAFTVLARR